MAQPLVLRAEHQRQADLERPKPLTLPHGLLDELEIDGRCRFSRTSPAGLMVFCSESIFSRMDGLARSGLLCLLVRRFSAETLLQPAPHNARISSNLASRFLRKCQSIQAYSSLPRVLVRSTLRQGTTTNLRGPSPQEEFLPPLKAWGSRSGNGGVKRTISTRAIALPRTLSSAEPIYIIAEMTSKSAVYTI